MPHPPSEGNPPRAYPEFKSYDYGCTGLSLYTEASWAAGWIEFLLDPPLVGETDYDEPQPKIDGMAFHDFFYPSDVVSGQDRDAMERLWAVLEAARAKDADGTVSTHVGNNVYNAIGAALGGWTGDSAVNLETYREELHNFYPDHLNAIGSLAQCLVAYSAVIGRARDDLALVMRQFVDTMEQFQHDANDPQRERLTVFAVLGQWVLSVYPFEKDASVVFASILGKALEKAVPEDKDKGGHDPADIGGSTYNEIAASFLRAVNRITEDARDAIEDITKKVRDIPNGLTAPPALGPV